MNESEYIVSFYWNPGDDDNGDCHFRVPTLEEGLRQIESMERDPKTYKDISLSKILKRCKNE